MKKNTLLIIILAVAALGLMALGYWNANRYVPYCPVVRGWGDAGDYYDNTHLSETHLDNICKVLDEYKEPYRRENGQVLIKNELLQNMDLLANYTLKAHYGEDDLPLLPTAIEDSVIHFTDRRHPRKELNYYFYSNKCFITEGEFSSGSRNPVNWKFFMVNKVDMVALQDLSRKFLRQGVSPAWKKEPLAAVRLWYRGDQSKIFGYLNPEVYEPLLSELEKLVTDKRAASGIPEFFHRPQNKQLLDVIQFTLPEE